MKKKYLILAMAIAAPLAFVGCGGGGGGGSTTGTTTSESVVFGKIDAFGSVIIGNRKLTTDDNTQVIIGDDNPKPWDDNTKGGLLVGHVATVDDTNGHADLIKVDENVKGPVDSVNPSLVVMGQTVVQNAGTLVDNSCALPFSPAVNDVLEVYGFVDDSGAIQANIIQCKGTIANTTVNRYSVIGEVSGYSGGNTFQVGGLTVDMSGADTSDLAGGVPQNGQLVQVKDDLKTYAAGSAALSATKVEPQASFSTLAASTTQKVEIETYVTAVGVNSFSMGDLTVTYGTSTTFLYGTADLIRVGIKLEAEGFYNADTSSLDAIKIKFEDSESRVDAFATASDSNANTITLLNGAVVVGVDDNTEFEDSITVGNAIGQSLEVRGYIGSNGNFVASEVRNGNDKADRVEIRSTAGNLNAAAGTLTVMGITVNTNSSTQFKDHNDQLLSKDAFFAALIENVSAVEARWDPYNNDLSAPVKELELQDD